MRFVTFKGERNLSELARRVFDIKGPKAAEHTKEAAAALLRTNPHLRELKEVPEGTPIIVPNVPGVPPAETQPAVAAEILAHLRETLKGAQAALEQSLSREAEEAQMVGKLIQGRELKKLIKEAPELTDRLPQIARAAEARLREVGALKQSLKHGLAQLQKDLDEFTGT